MASWGQAGRHRPHRVHAASTMRTCGPSTATASAGHTRTHARQATHLSGSILKSTDSTAGALRRGHRRGEQGVVTWARIGPLSNHTIAYSLSLRYSVRSPIPRTSAALRRFSLLSRRAGSVAPRPPSALLLPPRGTTPPVLLPPRSPPPPPP